MMYKLKIRRLSTQIFTMGLVIKDFSKAREVKQICVKRRGGPVPDVSIRDILCP